MAAWRNAEMLQHGGRPRAMLSGRAISEAFTSLNSVAKWLCEMVKGIYGDCADQCNSRMLIRSVSFCKNMSFCKTSLSQINLRELPKFYPRKAKPWMAPGSDGHHASKCKENPSWLGKNVGMPLIYVNFTRTWWLISSFWGPQTHMACLLSNPTVKFSDIRPSDWACLKITSGKTSGNHWLSLKYRSFPVACSL